MYLKSLGFISNTNFVLIERLVTSIFGLLSVVAIARLMGPADYGSFAYVSSVAGIFLAAGHLGLDGLLVKEFVKNKRISFLILGTSSFIKLSVLLIFGILLICYGYLNPIHTHTEKLLFLVFGLLFVSHPFTSVLNSWFQANEHFKYASLLRIFIVFASTSLKLLIIFKGFSIESVGLVHSMFFVVEAVFAFALFSYLKGTNIRNWRFSKALSRSLIKEGAPLFLGTVLAVVYFKVDIVMLRYYHDEIIVGNYALIPRLLQVVQIAPMVITMVAFPHLVRLLNTGEGVFFNATKNIYSRVQLLAIIIGLGLFFTGGDILIFVFGKQFESAVLALKIACLSIPFLFIRIVSTKIFIALNLGKKFIIFEALGLLVNIVVNFLLIPPFGGAGAAIATVCSLCFSSIFSLFLFKKSREILRIIFNSIIPFQY